MSTYREKIKFYRADNSVPALTKGTDKSVGFDVYAIEDTLLEPGVPTLVRTGLVIQVPEDCYFTLHMRSGIAYKNAISLVNDVGIVDEDYCGPEDEVKFAMIKHYSPIKEANVSYKIKKGDKIGQIIFHNNYFNDVELEEQTNLDFAGKSRGGFGSTGK